MHLGSRDQQIVPYLFELGHPVRRPNFEGGPIIRNTKIPIFMLKFAPFLLGNNVNAILKSLFKTQFSGHYLFTKSKTGRGFIREGAPIRINTVFAIF